MVILHVAVIEDNKVNGASLAAKKHAEEQAKYEKVGLLNLCDNNLVKDLENVKTFNMTIKSIDDLEPPFNKPDLVVFHEIYKIQYVKIYKQLVKKNISYIIIPHCSLVKEAQKKSRIKKKVGNFLLFNSFIKNAKSIQYLCEGEKNNSVMINSNFLISGNGIDIPEKTKEYGDNNKNKAFEMIYIGRYDIYHKGLDLMIKSIYLIKDYMKENNMTLSVYGKDYEDKFKKLIEKYEINDIVKYNGPIYGEDKQSKLRESDLFIQTSRLEGQPLGVMEAISLGLPCVVTKGTNLGELVEKEKIGWMSRFDEKELAEKIKLAHQSRNDYPEISKRAISYAKDNFMWEKVSKDAIKKYNELLKV